MNRFFFVRTPEMIILGRDLLDPHSLSLSFLSFRADNLILGTNY